MVFFYRSVIFFCLLVLFSSQLPAYSELSVLDCHSAEAAEALCWHPQQPSCVCTVLVTHFVVKLFLYNYPKKMFGHLYFLSQCYVIVCDALHTHMNRPNSCLLVRFIFLWPPYVIGGPLYFCPVISFLLLSSCLLYTSPSPRDRQKSRMPSSA